MFCVNCGTQLPDGSAFCSACGKKQIEQTSVDQPVVEEVQEAVPVVEDIPTEPVAGEVQQEEAVTEDTQDPAPAAEVAAEPVQPPKKKKSPIKVIVGIVVALVLLAALAAGAYFMFFSNLFAKNAYLYYANGKYGMVTNLKKGETYDFASARSDVDYFALQLSPDGKYAYYLTKIDRMTYGATLCRVEFGKLKEDSDKNSDYIETIANDVYWQFKVLENGTVLYQDEDNDLMFFDGKESVRISKNTSVGAVTDVGDNRIVFFSTAKDNSRILYGVDLANPEEKIKLLYDFSYLIGVLDSDNIFCVKRGADGDYSTWVTGFNKDAEEQEEGIQFLANSDGKLYYVVRGDTKLNLYDYVNDPNAAEDAATKEPVMKDFSYPAYKYSMLTGIDLQESNYDELYTSCIKNLHWFSKIGNSSRSMEGALKKKWGKNTNAIHEAIENFINTYGHTADQQGYIKVTPEVKAALQEIAQLSENPEDWHWLWFCFSMQESGTEVDYDAYNEAYEAWTEQRTRNQLRELLKNPDNGISLATLYCYENGAATVVAENIVSYSQFNGGLVYNTVDTIDNTVDIQDIQSLYAISEVKALLALDATDRNCVFLYGDTICQMSEVATEHFVSGGYPQMAFTDDEAYVSWDNGDLYMASIVDGSVGEFQFVEDEAVYLSVTDNALYYATEVEFVDEHSYGNIYSCIDGVTTCVAKDVILEGVTVYVDGAITAYTDFEYGEGYELTLIRPDGEQIRIADGVYRYTRVDESRVMYISDGDLYVHNGKEKVRLKKNVSNFWTVNEVEVVRELTLDTATYVNYYGAYLYADTYDADDTSYATQSGETPTMPTEGEYN